MVRASGKASLKLLKRWCSIAPEEPFAERKEFGRFKVLAQVRNIDDVSIPSFAKRYNGKPALIRKTGMLYRCGPSGSYLNMDINVHAFGYMARSGLQSIFRDFQDFILSVGFTVESRSDDELPECILGCFDLNHVDYNAAVPWEPPAMYSVYGRQAGIFRLARTPSFTMVATVRCASSSRGSYCRRRLRQYLAVSSEAFGT